MEFDIEWLQHDEPDQRQDIFYCEGYEHSPVCIIKGNGKQVLISCDGEMRIIHKINGDDYIITDYWDLIEAGIKTDEDVYKVLEDADWDCNPWFDAYDISMNYQPELGPDNMGIHLDMVSGDLDEIIGLVKRYIEKGN